MSEQYYRLVTSFDSDEWPYEMNGGAVRQFNIALPQYLTASLTPLPNGMYVEIYESVGERNEHIWEMEGDDE